MQTGTFVNPESVSTHFHLKEGDVVADLGAGSGQYMRFLSKAVGESGKVYMGEIQKPLVEALGSQAREQHLSNVNTLWCDIESPGGIKLNDGALDAALLSNTLFQIENKQVAAAEIARILRSGGQLFIIDWTESFSGMGPHPGSVCIESEARALFEQVGFKFLRDFPAGDHHYGIALKKR